MGMKNVFELDTNQTTGPTQHGSLHAGASLNLNPAAEQAPPPEAPGMVMSVRATLMPAAPVMASLPEPTRPLTIRPTVSFIISTFNRRDVLLRTLGEVDRCGLKSEEYETLVVDNASTDGTSQAVRRGYPMIHLLHQEYNAGPVSKNLAIRSARGRFIVFLDDDSYPQPGAIQRMIRHFESDSKLGAAVFTVTLPDGSRECSAYPNVFIGCGTGFRRHALEAVGGLPEDFFMQAEEYDLSIRLLDAGWEIRPFDDIHVTHLKSPAARSAERTTELDVRNNLVLITRYFPKKWVVPFVRDWSRRYRLIANAKGHEMAYYKGLLSGLWRTMKPSNRRPVSERTFEKLTRMNEIELRMKRARDEMGFSRALLIDFGKNMLPYHLAARKLGIEIVAIADARLGGHGRKYRKTPIFDDEMCRRFEFDVAIVSNLSPVHAQQRREAWRAIETRPVLDLFENDRFASVNFADRAAQGFPAQVA